MVTAEYDIQRGIALLVAENFSAATMQLCGWLHVCAFTREGAGGCF